MAIRIIVTQFTAHCTLHALHATRQMSHVTRHMPHVTRHVSHDEMQRVTCTLTFFIIVKENSAKSSGVAESGREQQTAVE